MGCPVGETLRWFLSNEHSRSPESTRPSVEVIEVLTGTDMEKAEELARDCMNTQIKILKTQAEQHMVGSYDPRFMAHETAYDIGFES